MRASDQRRSSLFPWQSGHGPYEPPQAPSADPNLLQVEGIPARQRSASLGSGKLLDKAVAMSNIVAHRMLQRWVIETFFS